ncbi:MAG: hypothetical protein EBZ74_07360 [Planctomycetia bacterium]|nr:hypothetical protein [Planctomycetia bacterium]
MIVRPAESVSAQGRLVPGVPAAGGVVAGRRPLTTAVITADVGLRHRLRSIAIARGAVCRVPETLAAAWRAAVPDHSLVFVDVARPLEGRAEEIRALAESLAARPGVLLAVCGRPFASEAERPRGGDDEECWARQVGAFVYLPGVGTDSGVALLVDEARRIFRSPRGSAAGRLPPPEP